MKSNALKKPDLEEFKNPFVYDVLQLRARAKANLTKAPMTPAYRGDVQQTIEILQAVLATEIVCMSRYTMNAITAAGTFSENVKKEFLEHARDEHEHMERVAARIYQLGGKPDFNPQDLATRDDLEQNEAENLVDMLEENLVAERIVCEHYRDLIRFFADRDGATRTMLEELLVKEEEHAKDMHHLLTVHEGRPILVR